MKFYQLNTFYIVNDIVEHSAIKSQLLKYIDKVPDGPINDNYGSVSKTDWHVDKDYQRDYLNLFYDTMKPYLVKMCDEMGFKEWWIDNTWYQVYNKNDTHKWHVHANANYTNVYYLDLPDTSIKTQIKDEITNSIIDIDVHEGQLITFPANIKHRSPVNDTGQQKVIISFNSNFNAILQ